MRKIFCFMLLFIISLVTFNVHAVSCTEQDQERIISAAKKIEIKYQHTNGLFFDIIITNLDKNMYLYDKLNKKKIYGTGDVITLNYYFGGKAYNFMVFPKEGACSDRGLYTILVKVPSYNMYSETDFCLEHPDFKYCDPWYDGIISLDAFNKAVKEYESNQKKNEDDATKKPIISGLKDFYKDYKLYIIGGLALVVVSIGAIIVYSIKSRRTIKL